MITIAYIITILNEYGVVGKTILGIVIAVCAVMAILAGINLAFDWRKMSGKKRMQNIMYIIFF